MPRQHQPAPQPPRRQRGRVDAGHRAQREPLHPVPGSTAPRAARPRLGGQRRDVGRDRRNPGRRRRRSRGRYRAPTGRTRGPGVMARSKTTSSRPRTAMASAPGSAVPGGNTRIPRMVGAQAQFGGRADHAVGGPAVGLARGDPEVAGQRGARQCHHHEIADREVRCPADDVAGVASRHRPCRPGWAS